MRYTTEQLSYEVGHVGSADAIDRHGSKHGSFGDVAVSDGDRCDHAVIDNEAHPLAKVVCYATKKSAGKIAKALNCTDTKCCYVRDAEKNLEKISADAN